MATGNSAMKMVEGAGWSRGLANVLRGELGRWFGTRTWWRQIIIWAAAINLIFLIVVISNPPSSSTEDTPLMIFNIFMGLAGPIGVSIIMQSVVVGEKRAGTAAWILSKPVSRAAFILSKLLANTAGIAVCMVLAQGIIAYAIAAVGLKTMLPIPGFLAALLVHLVNIFFYLTLTLMLGTLFEVTAPVIGIPLAFLFAQNFLLSFYPPLAQVMPYTLAIPINNDKAPSIAMALMSGSPVPSFLPVAATLIYAVIFVAVGVSVFRKTEL
jgi:ABC-2 type transport system permease protein